MVPGQSERSLVHQLLRARYVDDSEDKQLCGAYGPRLFGLRGNNQIANVRDLLRQKPQSRRAVIQLFEADDIARPYKEAPCTCTLQFAIRRERLDMPTSMCSNDAFLGLPHDVFAFTMLKKLWQGRSASNRHVHTPS